MTGEGAFNRRAIGEHHAAANQMQGAASGSVRASTKCPRIDYGAACKRCPARCDDNRAAIVCGDRVYDRGVRHHHLPVPHTNCAGVITLDGASED
eukprot:1266481-Prymnesium_polylepis.1